VLTFGAPFRVFWQSIKDLFEELLLLIIANVIWAVISLPLLVIAWLFFVSGATTLGVIALLVAAIPLAPATVGLFCLAQGITEGRAVKIGLFFEGFRSYLKLSWTVYVPWMAGLALILVNLQFYAGMSNSIGIFLFFLFVYFLLIWFALLIYLGPLLLLQSDKRLRVIARNSLLMTLGRPLFTLITAIMMAIIFVLAVVVPLVGVLVGAAFLALWGFRACTRLIEDAEARRAARDEEAAGVANRLSSEKGRGGQIRPPE
jgi:uncharacterized membrane protein YesL